jgi:hypothetical protein
MHGSSRPRRCHSLQNFQTRALLKRRCRQSGGIAIEQGSRMLQSRDDRIASKQW